MQTLTYLLLIGQLVNALTLPRDDRNRAVYFLDNNPAGSSIVSLKIDPKDGKLSNAVRTPTGGKGLFALTAPNGGGTPTPGSTDTLFSQDSVVTSQNYLFTVNAGSNELSMFFIDKNDPYHPRLLNTAPTQGDFPVAVAYSSHLKTACAVNAGAVAGVTCFKVDSKKGLTPLGALRPIALHQTTPPVGPPGTVSDIVFNPSQTALVVTIKGSPTTPGFFYIYPVQGSTISTTPIITQLPGVFIAFSISFLGTDSRAVVTDPAYGAAIVDIGPAPAFTLSQSQKTVIPNERATCWSVYSKRFNTIFIMDVGVSNVTLLDPATGNIKGVVPQSASEGGSVDAIADQTYLYVLRGGSFVSVIDNKGLNSGKIPRDIQSFDLSGLGSRQGFTGMAVYPSS